MKQLGLLLVATSVWAWEPLAPMPVANGGFACGFVEGKLLTAGGTNWEADNKNWLSAIWSYDPKSNRWNVIGKLPEPRAYAASGVLNGKLVLGGGSDGERALSTMLAIDARGIVTELGTCDSATIYSSSGVLGDTLVMAGGATSPSDLNTLSSIVQTLRLEQGRSIFIARAEAPTFPGFGFGAAAGAGKAYLFGGAIYHSSGTVVNQDWVYSLTEKGMIKSASRLPKPVRGLTAVAISDRFIYIGGGYLSDEVGFTDEAFLFDAETETFTSAPPLPIAGMVHFASDDHHLYCLGGEDAKKQRSSKVWRLPIKGLLTASTPATTQQTQKDECGSARR